MGVLSLTVPLSLATQGANFKPDASFTPSAVKLKWKEVQDFSSGSEYPTGMSEKDPMVSHGSNLGF
jgi:hypothetical protein